MKTVGIAALAVLLCVAGGRASASEVSSTVKTDLRGLKTGMLRDDVEFYFTNCTYRPAPTRSQTSGMECDDMSIEFTSQLTGSLAYLITYKFCSSYTPRELTDEVTRQYNRRPVNAAKESADWAFNLAQGQIWKLNDDDLRLWLERADNLDQCKSGEQGWELHMLSLLLSTSDKRARADYENAHPHAPPPVFFRGNTIKYSANDHRPRQRPHRHPPDRENPRALRRPLRAALLHRGRAEASPSAAPSGSRPTPSGSRPRRPAPRRWAPACGKASLARHGRR